MSQRRDILLINKEIPLRDAGIGMLTVAGYSVHAAWTMRDALAKISTEPIGLILSGLELEDIQATDFLTYLKRDPLREAIPFVFYLHSQSQVDFPPGHALELGAADVILYPIAAGEFIHRVQKHLPAAGEQPRTITMGTAFFPESFLPRPPKTAGEKAGPPRDFREARLSLNGKVWLSCSIINHTFHGVMVETGLRGKQGAAVLIRYNLPEAPVTATGRLNHILLGDHGKPMGMGINFRGDPNWRRIHQYMKSTTEKASGAADKPAPAPPEKPVSAPAEKPAAPTQARPSPDRQVTPIVPIGIEASRDGTLWMYGEINAYDRNGATITTPILGKAGETLHLRLIMSGGQRLLMGRIKKVTLSDFKMPLGMELEFPEDAQWADIVHTGFGKGSRPPLGTETPRATAPTPIAPSLLKSIRPGTDGRPAPRQWAETIAVTQPPVKTESIKDRFYKGLIGKKLGSYEIVSFIEAGGMGGVFKGWDTALERDVAIKVISYELSSQKAFVEMFFKEARLVSKLNHPNIAHIYFIGNESGIVYYAMEFIHGKTLAELIQTDGRLPADRAVGYLVDACRALDRVWREKIIHRDIKPANIMISAHGTVKLLDFGVARQQKKEAARAETNIVGSPPYLSPETIREQPVDLRSDIYSLGATFYHVMSGAPPFTGNSIEEIFQQHLDSKPTPLKKKLPDLPPLVSDTVDKMLAKHPRDRFQSYQEIIETLSNTETNYGPG